MSLHRLFTGCRCAQVLTYKSAAVFWALLICRGWDWEVESSKNEDPSGQRLCSHWQWKTLSKKSGKTHCTSGSRNTWDQPLCSRAWHDLENSAWIHVLPTIPSTMRSCEPECPLMTVRLSWKWPKRRKDTRETKQS